MAALNRPLVIAHRGHSVAAPEQTVAAFRAAVELGADMIEADVHRTRDGRLVLCHDCDVDRTTSGRGRVADHTFDELRALDAGSWFDSRFAAERVPSLDELYDLAVEAGVALCLEVKGESPAERAETACAVGAEIVARDRLARDVLASFDHRALAAAVRAAPGLRLAPERLPERGPADASRAVAQAKAAAARIVQHHHEDLDAATVTQAHAAGIAVWAWAPNTPEAIARVLALGVDAVMGDDVAALRAAVGEYFRP